MRFLIYALIAVAAYFILGWIYFTVKALKDPDVQEASKLRMQVKNFRKYRSIYDEEMTYLKAGKTQPNRYEEISNFNEWRRYQQYRQEIADKQYYDSLPDSAKPSFRQSHPLKYLSY